MDIHNWIIAQLAIDAFLAFCILLFIRHYIKSKKKDDRSSDIFQRPEVIISEMQELTKQLDKNLEEKKELSRKILHQLDEGLKRAEESFDQLQGVIREFSTKGPDSRNTVKDSEKMWSSVRSLMAKGVKKEEIAQYMGISVGEIDLMVKLRNHDKRD